MRGRFREARVYVATRQPSWLRRAARHPVYVALREDKPAPQAAKRNTAARKTASRAAAGSRDVVDTVAGARLTHSDKIMFPEAKIKKRDLAMYYADIADWIVPHLDGRPLSLLRCPDGREGECFYQKHADRSVHPAVLRCRFAGGHLSASCNGACWNCIHGARAPQLDKPDRLVFDLDPADDVPWSALRDAVLELRTLLDQLGLRGLLKTTGARACMSWCRSGVP